MPAYPGKNPVPLDVEFNGFDPRFEEIDCHRRQPVSIGQPGIMLRRKGELMGEVVGEALELLASQFYGSNGITVLCIDRYCEKRPVSGCRWKCTTQCHAGFVEARVAREYRTHEN